MKRIISLYLALVLFAAAPVYGSAVFSDVRQTDWFFSYVETAKRLGIVSGYPDGSFRPDNPVTYGEFLAMAMRGRASSGAVAEPDLHWAQKFYDAALSLGVFEAAQISSRFLSEPIPRKDVALVMAGLLGTAGLGGRNVRQADLLYSDVDASEEREYPIALCSYYGVLSGYPDGSFRPLDQLKRSEAAAAMVALDGVLQEGQTELPEPAGEAVPPELPEPSMEPPEKAEEPAPEPSTREELLNYEGEKAFRRTGDPKTLEFMAKEALDYLQRVIASARFVQEEGRYLVRVSWPNLPEGYGASIDVTVSDANGTGMDGRVWVCRRGMERMQTYAPELKSAGNGEYVFDLKNLQGVGSADILTVLVREDGKKETSMAMAIQDLAEGTQEIQYKLESDRYRLSCTLSLEDDIFLWK